MISDDEKLSYARQHARDVDALRDAITERDSLRLQIAARDAENDLLRAQLVQCTTAMRGVAAELREIGAIERERTPGSCRADPLAQRLEDARGAPVKPKRDWTADVAAFMTMLGQPFKTMPELADKATYLLRLRMLDEEVTELKIAIGEGDIEGVADAFLDVIYIAIGGALDYGIDPRPVWDEVHASNMAKAGGPRRADGKVMKPEGWKPPDIAAALKRGSLKAGG
jgi:predicted HAD superfamily Cof-like phosphohydrolase